MPVCFRTSARVFTSLLCRRRTHILRDSKITYHSLGVHALASNVAFNRANNRIASGTGPGGTSRPGPVCDPRLWSYSSMSSTAMSNRIVWVDLEMTGLDIEKDKIIEMACIITDSDLKVLAEGPHLIINQPEELLEGMSEWCRLHHGRSGLTRAVMDSKITLEQAEYEFLSFIRQHTPPGQCPLAGNSVHADKRFLDKYMPQFMHHLHYRIIDVSTIKELCRRWFPEDYKMVPQKKATHRALEDIRESIKELQHYRLNVFKVPEEEKKKSRLVENGGSNTY